MEAEIAVRQLESGGFSCTWKRVDSEAALRARSREAQTRRHPFRFHAAGIRWDLRAGDFARDRARHSVHLPLRHARRRARHRRLAARRLRLCAQDQHGAAGARGAPRAQRCRHPPRRASRSNSSCATSSPPRRTGSGSTIATASSRSAATRCAARSDMRRRKCSARNASQYVHPEDLAALDFAMHTLGPNQRTATNLQARWRHRNGSYRWLERNMLVLLGEGGQVDRVIAAASATSPNAAARKNTSAV